MTAPKLPEDVERAIAQFAHAARAEATDPTQRAIDFASEKATALRAAIAAHVAPPVSASFEEALTGLDVEPRHDPARYTTTYDILGLDDVRAAHRAEVDAMREERNDAQKRLAAAIIEATDASIAHAEAVRVAVEAEREACAALVRPERFGTRECSCDTLAEDAVEAILARGAKS